jgi:hypothetical protein
MSDLSNPALPNPVLTADYWRQQVNNWKHSCQSQAKFCQANELPYHRFVYWRQKFERSSGSGRTQCASGGFATVDYRPEVSSGLSLSLPNGLVLRGISADNVPVVCQLLEQL